jgi:ComF family protein
MFQSFINFVLPMTCPCCRSIVASMGLCGACWKQLQFIIHPLCRICGSPLNHSSDQQNHSKNERGTVIEHTCASCLAYTPIFDQHRSLFIYNEISKKLVLSLKNGSDRSLSLFFANWLEALLLETRVDVLIPVPLHWSRLMRRTFNQSALVAQHLASNLGIPLSMEGLKRIRKTSSQGHLSRHLRIQNVAEAFRAVSKDVWGKNIGLIDDVCTTGATLNACALALKEAGALSVNALTLAKVQLC